MEPLLAADSFRVRMNHGRAESRGLERHLERFIRTAIQAAPVYEEPRHYSTLTDFTRDAVRRIADYGAGFPRLELRSDGELGLRLRPLPELKDSIELRSSPLLLSDGQQSSLPHGPAHHPERKGPNIDRYAALNRELEAEALLLSPEGAALEGTTTSILWWQGDVLYTVSESQRVSSVTEAILTDIAREGGVTTRTASISPEDLSIHEVWAVNALHGIRVVTSIDGVRPALANAERLSDYRKALDKTWKPIADR